MLDHSLWKYMNDVYARLVYLMFRYHNLNRLRIALHTFQQSKNSVGYDRLLCGLYAC